MLTCICLINQVYLLPTNTSVCTHMKKNPEFFKDISYLIVDVIEISLKKKTYEGILCRYLSFIQKICISLIVYRFCFVLIIS